jgi:hypothetical protein
MRSPVPKMTLPTGDVAFHKSRVRSQRKVNWSIDSHQDEPM